MTLTLGSLQQKAKRSRERLSALQNKLTDPSLSPSQRQALEEAIPHSKKALGHAENALRLRQKHPLPS
jgi:hypothetical protein